MALDSTAVALPYRQPIIGKYIFVGVAFILLEVAGLSLLGSQPLSLLALIVIDGGCLLLVLHYGLSDVNAMTIVAIFSFHLIVAAVIKLLIGQPLDENLLVPRTTFAIELVYFLALSMAFCVTRCIHVPNLFPRNIVDPNVLKYIAIGTSIISLAATFLYIRQSAEIGREYGEALTTSNPLLVAIRGFGTLGMVSCTARAVILANRQRLFDPLSFVIFALSVAVGISTNSREAVGGPIVAVGLAGLAFGYRPSMTTIISTGVLVVLFVSYISPALIVTRDQRDTLGPLERSVLALDVVADLMLNTPKAEEYRSHLTFNDTRLGEYFGFYDTLADRIGLVQTVDLVANGIDNSSYIDYDELPNVFSILLPENVFWLFGYERAAAVPVGDLVAWNSGISSYGFISFLAIPENAEAYAVGGLPAVAYRTFAAYGFCFIVIYLLGGADMRSNILAITLFLMFFHAAAEVTSVSLYYFALRIAPQFAISYFIIVKIAESFVGLRAMKSA